MDWSAIRARELPRLAGTTYLDSAYFGPLPERAVAAGRRALEEQAAPWNLVYEEWRTRPEAVRELAARLVHVPTDDVTIVTSTTELVNRLAQAIPLGRGDTVAAIAGDYPSIVLPWVTRERDGAVVRRLEPPSRPVEACWLDTELDETVRVLALTHVAFDTGARVDLDAISRLCEARGIWLVVDATQALGAVELDLSTLPGVSALAVSTYKWCLGPYGSAFGVVRPRLLAALERRWINWITSRGAESARTVSRITAEPLPGARALDRGQSPTFVPIAMQRASLELFLELGPGAIAARSRALADRLVLGLDRDRFELVTPEHARASIVSLRTRDTAHGARLEERLRAAKIRTSIREGNVRVSPHFFNDESEIDRLLEVLGER